jgi:hypothetical protein
MQHTVISAGSVNVFVLAFVRRIGAKCRGKSPSSVTAVGSLNPLPTHRQLWLPMLALSFLFAHGLCRPCAADPMPRGAYLRHPVTSVEALKRQLQTDPIVRDRYVRTFRMSPQMLALAFARLHLTRLRRDRILQVHYAHPDGQVGYRLRRVRAGTPVFALPNGTPALAQACGNPLRSALLTAGATLTPPAAAAAPDFTPDEMASPPAQRSAFDLTPRIAPVAAPLPAPTAPPITATPVDGAPPAATVNTAPAAAPSPSPTSVPAGDEAAPTSMPAEEAPVTDDFVVQDDALPPGATVPTPETASLAALSILALDELAQWLNHTTPRNFVANGGSTRTPLPGPRAPIPPPRDVPVPTPTPPIPEPSTVTLLIAGCVSAMLAFRRRPQKYRNC